MTTNPIGRIAAASWVLASLAHAQQQKVHPLLDRLNQEQFTPTVYRVTDQVYSAVGFSLANCILIAGSDGIVMVDTTEDRETGEKVLAEFRKIANLPVRAVIYTHNHGDHTGGVRAFVPENAAGQIDIYAHESLNDEVVNTSSVVAPMTTRRAVSMFGALLPKGEEGLVSAGLGPFLSRGSRGYLPPTRTYRDRLEVRIAGVKMLLFKSYGDSPDHTAIWLPDSKVLLAGDSAYYSFPNLYTIRGTKYRDPREWFEALDELRRLDAEHLVNSHSKPISGAAAVREFLTNYRDAIQYVHDQTVRHLNRGLTPDELVDAVKLPEHLASQPYLREYYGVVADCVRNIYFGYMGWFNADAATLEPLPYLERARRYVELAGGPGPMLEKIRTALANREHSWAAELATWLVRADRNQLEARRLKARALRELGYRQISANRRNFYLTAALELEGKIPAIPNSTGGPDTVQALPPSTRVKSMAVMLDPEKSRDVRLTLGFQITDANQTFALEIRRGVAEFHPTLPPARTATLVTSRRTLHSLLLGQTTLDKAVSSGEARVTGPQQAAASFFTYFDPWPRTIDARLSDR